MKLACTTCGEEATHLYGEIDLNDMTISSMRGVGVLSPSCEGCGGDVQERPFMTAMVPILEERIPLGIDPKWQYED